VGQSALEKKPILLTGVPDDYIQHQLRAGRGAAAQHHGAPDPLRGRGQGGGRAGLVHPVLPIHQVFLDQLSESVGVVLNMITANMRTEELLQQSQKLTQELQSQSQELQDQQEELRRTNAELEAQART
jgi:FtsZ-binding cell division protein ZapB